MALCCSYLALYGSYNDLLTLDVEAFVEGFAAQGGDINLADVSKEVARQVAELAYMEDNLLPTVNLGLLQVNCVKVSCLCIKSALPACRS